MIDNKTINCITLPLHKTYPVSSVARSNLKVEQSKCLLIPISQKCYLNDLSRKLLAHFDPSINMAEWGLLSLYEYEQIL